MPSFQLGTVALTIQITLTFQFEKQMSVLHSLIRTSMYALDYWSSRELTQPEQVLAPFAIQSNEILFVLKAGLDSGKKQVTYFACIQQSAKQFAKVSMKYSFLFPSNLKPFFREFFHNERCVRSFQAIVHLVLSKWFLFSKTV